MVEFSLSPMEITDPIPHVDVQKEIITEKLKTPVMEGQTWYLINFKWFETFKRFVGLEEKQRNIFALNPGPIDNSPLYDETKADIKPELFEDVDFVFVPEDVWDLLVLWYGQMEDQPPIAKKTYNCGAFVKHCKVEVYKLELYLFDNFDLKNGVIRKFSRIDPIKQIDEVARKVFYIPEDHETRLWGIYAQNTHDLLNMDSTLQDESLDHRHDVVIESRAPGAQWEGPRKKYINTPAISTSKATVKPSQSSSPSAAEKKALSRPCSTSLITTRSTNALNNERRGQHCEPGLCGLCNMGNTCFMNSVLQCMSNSPPITQYFLQNRHLEELNEANPLGMRGEIAKAFGELIQVIWSGRCSSTVPNAFKLQVGRFAPQFSGYQQHDSQELLTFLLDGLHEDLNRIKQKPYIELRDSDGRPDEVVANESWSNYLKRNDSIIVDVFHGLLKSRVVCPEADCEKVSITFDPFVYLSLPLPLKKDMTIQIRHIPYDQNQEEAEYRLNISKKGCIKDLCIKLSGIIHVSHDKLLIAEINKGHFHKFYSMDEPLERIDDRDVLCVYDLPCSPDDPTSNITPVVLWEAPEGDKHPHYLTCLFGIPFLIVLPQDPISYQKLYVLITKRLTRHCQIVPVKSSTASSTSVFNGNTSDTSTTDASESEIAEAAQELFQLYLVNSHTHAAAKKIPSDGPPIQFNEVLGRDIIALQWQRKVRLELYKDIQVTVHDTNIVTRPNKVRLSLEDCLNLYLNAEKLGADDAWYCPNCKKHERATKKFDLWKLPRILIFHLKRFSYSRAKRDKLDAFVDFPLTDFHMENYLLNKGKEEHIYDLIGICNHYGNLGGGHYTAYCKNNRDKRWYCFDDNSVTPLKEEVVVSQAAYVLFYMRRDPVPSNIPCTVTSESVKDTPMESE